MAVFGKANVAFKNEPRVLGSNPAIAKTNSSIRSFFDIALALTVLELLHSTPPHFASQAILEREDHRNLANGCTAVGKSVVS